MDGLSLDQVTPFISGGSATGLGLCFYLFVSGRLFNKDTTAFMLSEIDKRDKTIIEKDAYIKALVQDQKDLNETIRTDIIPAITTMNSQAIAISSQVVSLTSAVQTFMGRQQ